MAHAHYGGFSGHANARGADSPAVNISESSNDGWNAADPAQRLIDLDDEARARMTPDELSESNARVAAFWAQHEERALARYRSLDNQNDLDAGQGSSNMRTRPLDSQFGSDGNQYNPYAPHTSEEYMVQEIAAGRMVPEVLDIPRQPSDPAQSPLPGNDPVPPLARVHASGQSSWMAPAHRPPYRQSLTARGMHFDVSDPHDEPWFQNPLAASTAAEDQGEDEHADVYPALLPYFDLEEARNGSHSPHVTAPNLVSPNQEGRLGIPGPLASTLDRPSLNETFAIGAPRQQHSASTGRERKRLAKPSLVVKLKTPSTRKSSQASASLRRGRPDAPSPSDSSSAAHITQNSRPSKLRSQGSPGSSSANTRTGAGWGPQAVRRLTRRAEAIQSSQRKRRRDAVSPQDVTLEGTTTPNPGWSQSKWEKVNLARPC